MVRAMVLLNKAGIRLATIRGVLGCVPLADVPVPLCNALK